MPYDLNSDKLALRISSITFSSEESTKLRKSKSIEENAAFLVRWAAELYSDWATWIKHIFFGINNNDINADYKKGTLRIVNKIKEIEEENDFQCQGWTKLTDMLRASFICNNAS